MEQSNNAAKFAFFYLLSLVALIFMALSSGMIIFQIINKYIVDLIRQYSGDYSDDQMKFAISALIISTPIFYITSKQIMKSLFNGELGKDSQIRKWLSYLVLFVTSVIMIGWLIGVINGFLGGELTLKFILKAITAIGISAAVFSFYYYDIKREVVEGKKSQVVKMYFFNSLAFVLLVFIFSLFVVESPTQTRNRKLDERVISNFSQIDSEINRYYSEKGSLPQSFDTLKSEYSYLQEDVFTDPETGKRFDYTMVDTEKYKLCATFRGSSVSDNAKIENDRWPHESGYQCLEQKVGNLNGEKYLVPAR